jgi:hypothetical protein
MNVSLLRLLSLGFVAAAAVVLGTVPGSQGCELPGVIHTFPQLTQEAYNVLFHTPMCNGAWVYFGPMLLAYLLYRSMEPVLWTAVLCCGVELVLRVVIDDSTWWMWMPVWKLAASAGWGACLVALQTTLRNLAAKPAVAPDDI